MTSEPTSGCDPGIISSIPDDATDIDLHGVMLDAAAIQSLARFKSVQQLNLASCGLQVVPPEVISMASLKRLDLSNNPLQYLPAELGLIPHLEEVNVRATGLQSPYLELQTNPASVAHLLKWLNRPVKPQIRVFVPSRPADCTTVFTVVSYNILAPHCTRRRDHFPLTPAQYLDSAVRIPAIKNELECVRGDIFCLQEMEGGLFRDDFQSFMDRLGFTGWFCPKARAYGILDKKKKDLVMGEATFVRKDRFDVVATKQVDLREHRLCETLANHAEVKKHDETALLVLVKTRFCPGIHIMIVNLHLYWEDAAEAVRTSQLHIALEAALEFGYQHVDKFDIIIAGDFNSTPNSQPMAMLMTRPERFLSTYQVCGCCPSFTVCAHRYKVWIDHIFSTCWGIQPMSVLAMGNQIEFQKDYVALPASGVPSDHLMIATAFDCKNVRHYPPPRAAPAVETHQFVVQKPAKAEPIFLVRSASQGDQ